MIDITNPIFNDEEKAREYLEAQRWPNGAVCPFCKKQETVKTLPAEAMMSKPSKKNPISKATPGYYHCRECRKKFTVCTDSVMERTHIPLAKWVLAFRLMAASKKGMSALQLQRMLGVQYKTAWFLEMRIREAMTPDEAESGPIGGGNKVVESDETYVGGKAKNVHNGKPEPKKHAVVTLVERDGEVRAKHVPNVTAANIKEHLNASVDKASYLMTDESKVYVTPGKAFKGHASVNHSADEYVRLGGSSTSTPLRASMRSSSARCTAPITPSLNIICSATSTRSPSSGITASRLASTTRSAPRTPSKVQRESACSIGGLTQASRSKRKKTINAKPKT